MRPKVSQSVNINIDEDIEIIGAVVIGPDGDTHVVSDRFCYRNVDEYGWSKSTYFKPGEQPDFDGFKDKLYEAASVEADEAVEVSDSSEEGITVAFLGDEDARLVHTLIEVPVGSDETGLERIVIEEIVDLNAAQGGAREVSVTYDHLLDRVEIVYAEDSVKRRVMMPGSVFRENMLGVHHEGEAVYADLMHDIEKYVVHGDYRGASPYGFEFAEGGMTEAFQAFDQRVDSSGSNSLSTSEWLEIIFSSEVGYAALGGAKEYGLGLGEGVIDAVKAPFELLELFVKATDLAVNDPDGFREKVGELTQVFSQKETYVAMLNGMAQELTTSRGIGHISGGTITGMVAAGMMKNLKKVAKATEAEAIRLGTLKKIGEDTWESAGGLVYSGLDYNGLNRIEHVLLHTQPNPSKKSHTVFNVERNKVLELIDEAWMRRGEPLIDGKYEAYNIPMEKSIGTLGETTIRIVVDPKSKEVITAYPIKIS